MSMRSLWAVGAELHDKDPTAGIKLKRTDRDGNDGHLAWPIEVIEQREKRWPVGTRERLIFDIYLYDGVRRGDAARLGKQHIRRGGVPRRPQRRSLSRSIPIWSLQSRPARTPKASP